MLRFSNLTSLLRLDLIGPQKQAGSSRVDRDRNGEKGNLGCSYLGRSISCEQKKHPREKNHGVTIRELPSTRVSVAPKNERQKSNRNPAHDFVFSAASKKKEQEGTAQKNRTPKRVKTYERKIGVVAKTLKHHFVDVPGNRVQREEAVRVPRFVAHVRDMKIAKIQD